MNPNKKLAKVYASALVDTIADNDKLQETFRQFIQISQLFDQIPELNKYFASPILTRQQKTALVPVICNYDNPFLKRFFILLLEKNRFNILPELKEVFQEEVEKRLNQQTARIISAHELTQEDKEKIRRGVSVYFNKDIIAKHQVDKTLGSGVRVEIGNYIIDNSVKKRLSKVMETFS
ncbi:ATP synthase F1 subunit delta [Candidatus Margulisiibacteriota bacterium]